MAIFSAEELNTFCRLVLERTGVEPGCAADVARVLVDADLSGIESHGVSRLAIYVKRLQAGVVSPRPDMRILRESPSALTIDAGNALGAPAAIFAMEQCIARAGTTGCCFAAVRNGNHFGTAGYYARLAAERGMIGFTCTNLTGKIAPHGAAEPYMGTNPIAVAVPSAEEPLVLDMTPSVVALGKLILAQKLGQPIPTGWALDPSGQPTTDPAAGRAGSLIPMGGPKGSGLAIMVEVLSGILSGAGVGPHLHDLYGDMEHPQGIGHFLGAIDVSAFMDPALFRENVSRMCGEIRALRPAPGTDRILLPGQRSAECRAQRRKDGIPLSDIVTEELRQLGAPYGLTL